ncbi:MAG TPA: cupin domain-containing protein [Polyangiaceae bacterium]|jgi:quercetin dioxygenase-like cupin family protein|nr:cupin domain-containing protein [Polyangiaceae bacterium]
MNNPNLSHVSHDDAPAFSAEPGLERRILAHNPRLMIVEHHMRQGWAGARHSHPHDQAVYVVSGHLRFLCGDEAFEARAGDSFVVRGGVEHQAWALEAAHVIDIFTPAREDYISKQ